ncbi:MAG: DNA-binding protein [Sandaracinus sp.]|nr:DNA-binding protein [Sandaracinus sp.]
MENPMTKNPSLLRCLFLAAFALALGFAAPPAPVGAQDVGETVEEPEQSAPTVDLNHATEAELISLPGIGPSKAQAILAYRERRPFRRVQDIMRVRGIGRGTYRQIRNRLTVTAPSQE